MIRDLLWACVTCGAVEQIAPARRGVERCRACGTEYRRGRGSHIVVREQGSAPVEKPAGEWAVSLPPVDPYGTSRVQVRTAVEDRPFFALGVYMGRYERMGPLSAGWLDLDADRIRFQADAGEGFDWPLLELSAIQMSSSTLQLKAKGQPLVSIRLESGSARLWEERLQAAVREAYARAGKGEVVEFQPRICTR